MSDQKTYNMSDSNSFECERPKKRSRGESEQSTGSSESFVLRRSQRESKPKAFYPLDKWINEARKMEAITTEHALCMYESGTILPQWLMLGGPSSESLYYVDVERESTKVKMKKLHLNVTQTKKYDFFVECVEAMFGGLIYDQPRGVWHDEKHLSERFDDCVSLTKKYGMRKDRVVNFADVYNAFTLGFTDCRARMAMQSLCNLCIMILEIDPEEDHVFQCVNVGGSSTLCDSACKVVKLYAENISKKTTEEVLEMGNVTEVDTIFCHTHIPDFVLVRTEKCVQSTAKYCLFGECKNDSKDQLSSKLWHQTLKGLFQNDTSYGCSAKASSFLLMKIEKCYFNNRAGQSINPVLKTSTQKFSFVSMEPAYEFNTSDFCKAAHLIVKIIQDNID